MVQHTNFIAMNRFGEMPMFKLQMTNKSQIVVQKPSCSIAVILNLSAYRQACFSKGVPWTGPVRSDSLIIICPRSTLLFFTDAELILNQVQHMVQHVNFNGDVALPSTGSGNMDGYRAPSP
jgi:hypothetical protein